MEERDTAGAALVPARQAAALAATGFVAGVTTVGRRPSHARPARRPQEEADQRVRGDRVVELVPDRRPPAAPRLSAPPGPTVLIREVVVPPLAVPAAAALARRPDAPAGRRARAAAARGRRAGGGRAGRARPARRVRRPGRDGAGRPGGHRPHAVRGGRGRRPGRVPRTLPGRPADRPRRARPSRHPRAPAAIAVGGADAGDHRAADRRRPRGGDPAPADPRPRPALGGAARRPAGGAGRRAGPRTAGGLRAARQAGHRHAPRGPGGSASPRTGAPGCWPSRRSAPGPWRWSRCTASATCTRSRRPTWATSSWSAAISPAVPGPWPRRPRCASSSRPTTAGRAWPASTSCSRRPRPGPAPGRNSLVSGADSDGARVSSLFARIQRS